MLRICLYMLCTVLLLGVLGGGMMEEVSELVGLDLTTTCDVD